MSNSVAIRKLAVIDTIKDGVAIGTKNIGPIIVNIILWALTFWIPYFNVGTTIGLSVGIVSKASKGQAIPMTEIFDPKYRKYMGEFFLTFGLMNMGITAALIFLVIPGIVVGIAWSLALVLAVDKGKNPTEAISLSNKCTYGNKFRMFCVYAAANVAVFISAMIIMSLFGRINLVTVGFLLTSVLALFAVFVNIGLFASIYRQLTENIGDDGPDQGNIGDIGRSSIQQAQTAQANVRTVIEKAPLPGMSKPEPTTAAAEPAPQPQKQAAPEQLTVSSQPSAQNQSSQPRSMHSFSAGSGGAVERKKTTSPVVIVTITLLILAAAGGGAYYYWMMLPSAESFSDTGKSHYEAKNFADAVDYFSKAINRNPREADFYNWRGKAYFEMNNYESAIADFSEAARLAPGVAEYHYHMGETFTTMDEHQKAVASYSQAIQIDPDNPLYHFGRGDANNANKAYRAAIADYTQAIRLDPNDARYYNNRGGTYRQMEDYAKAIPDYNEAIRLNPNDARYRNNRGVTHHLSKNYPAAIADYTQAIRLAPDNARYRNNRGGVHNLMKNYAEAAADFREALRLEPDNKQYSTNLEQAEERLQRQQSQWQW